MGMSMFGGNIVSQHPPSTFKDSKFQILKRSHSELASSTAGQLFFSLMDSVL